ncbi:transcriptional regulatory protein AlgP-like [Anomalospiza imberbis]|uniref:transcriptional regulatory protein AlgP-like n=1 Tax=Anomalospiza imberbis TaxID=187417 RepID=UPI00358F1A59
MSEQEAMQGNLSTTSVMTEQHLNLLTSAVPAVRQHQPREYCTPEQLRMPLQRYSILTQGWPRGSSGEAVWGALGSPGRRQNTYTPDNSHTDWTRVKTRERRRQRGDGARPRRPLAEAAGGRAARSGRSRPPRHRPAAACPSARSASLPPSRPSARSASLPPSRPSARSASLPPSLPPVRSLCLPPARPLALPASLPPAPTRLHGRRAPRPPERESAVDEALRAPPLTWRRHGGRSSAAGAAI